MKEQPNNNKPDKGLKNTYRIGCGILILIIIVLAFGYLFGYMEF